MSYLQIYIEYWEEKMARLSPFFRQNITWEGDKIIAVDSESPEVFYSVRIKPYEGNTLWKRFKRWRSEEYKKNNQLWRYYQLMIRHAQKVEEGQAPQARDIPKNAIEPKATRWQWRYLFGRPVISNARVLTWEEKENRVRELAQQHIGEWRKKIESKQWPVLQKLYARGSRLNAIEQRWQEYQLSQKRERLFKEHQIVKSRMIPKELHSIYKEECQRLFRHDEEALFKKIVEKLIEPNRLSEKTTTSSALIMAPSLSNQGSSFHQVATHNFTNAEQMNNLVQCLQKVKTEEEAVDILNRCKDRLVQKISMEFSNAKRLLHQMLVDPNRSLKQYDDELEIWQGKIKKIYKEAALGMHQDKLGQWKSVAQVVGKANECFTTVKELVDNKLNELKSYLSEASASCRGEEKEIKNRMEEVIKKAHERLDKIEEQANKQAEQLRKEAEERAKLEEKLRKEAEEAKEQLRKEAEERAKLEEKLRKEADERINQIMQFFMQKLNEQNKSNEKSSTDQLDGSDQANKISAQKESDPVFTTFPFWRTACLADNKTTICQPVCIKPMG